VNARLRSSRLVLLLIAICCGSWFSPVDVPAGGVTVITHGFNANVTDWVIPMLDKIPSFRTFPGTNVSEYQISITRNASTYSLTSTFLDGVAPSGSDSGEILIALDWSTLSSGAVPTTDIAAQTAIALLSTTLIPDLNGHPLAELPLHFAGHSRGGSVITEAARLLGAQGVWVDHVTTLDPHPVSQFGDPPMTNYANILYADNFWQNLGDGLFVPNGQAITGAYNRQLTNLNGGYSSSHSDVHLWYHGTIDLKTPASDTQATITSTERQLWWTTAEAFGTNTGFLNSLIGAGDRFSNFEPGGAGKGKISDGYNKVWDFGAGLAANRVFLPANNGSWPNLLRLNVIGTNHFASGDAIPAAFYYQCGANTGSTALVRLVLDADPNPLNANAISLTQTNVPSTGTNNIGLLNLTVTPNAAATQPGTYYVYGTITDGLHTRYLYAPQRIVLEASRQAPVLVQSRIESGLFHCTVAAQAGQRVVVQGSTDLIHWLALQTNVMAGTSWDFADPASGNLAQRFYRALLQ
jgi:hypothetical protein